VSQPLRIALFALAASCLLAGTAAAAQWRAVPGAPELEIDVTSLQQERTRVSAWLRWWGRPALVPELAALGPRSPRVVRTATQLEFDCGQRTARTLAVHAYGSSGAPVFMSGIAGPPTPVRDADLAWAYDAVCEAARSGSRF
jgi:hypothetical protein